MKKKELKTSLILIAILFITMLIVSGGTFAYLQWQTSTDQLTALNVSVTDDINMRIDPASVTKTGMRPTNNCGGEFSMVGTSTVTIDNQTGVQARPRFKLKIKITDKDGNNITNEVSAMDENDGDDSTNKPYMYYIKYAVTEEDGDCTSPIIEGRFSETTETIAGSGWYDSPSLTLDTTAGFPDLYTSVSFKAKENAVTNHTYKVTVWIDENYTTVNVGDTVTVDKLQDATITVSWSDNSTVEQVDSTADRPLTEAYAVYSADDTSLRFYRSETPITRGSTYNDLTVTAVYSNFENDSSYTSASYVPWDDYRSSITNVVFEDEIVPISTHYWFYEFKKCTDYDLTKLNTLNVTDMSAMFYSVYSDDKTSFTITGMDNWDTSNVTDMSSMFGHYYASSATIWNIGDLSGWDTSKVTDMSDMFNHAGWNAVTWDIGDIGSWNVSNVTNMDHMFYQAGHDATEWNIGNLSDWDTSNVIDMGAMFYGAGSSSNYSLNLSSWDVDSAHYWGNFSYEVTDKITEPNWNTGEIYYAVYSADDASLRFYGDSNTITEGGTFNNLTVTNLYELCDNLWYNDFDELAWKEYHFNITTIVFEDEITPINTSYWFYDLENASTFDFTNLNTLNVTDMSYMFYETGYNIGDFSLDLSGLNTSNVTNMKHMFYSVARSSDSLSLNLSGWDTSKVTNMSGMFEGAGYAVTSFNIIGLKNWDVSSVTDMSSMFDSAAGMDQLTSLSFDLSGWNTLNVTTMNSMFRDMGTMERNLGDDETAISLNLSGWDVSNVTSMSWMFYNTGKYAKSVSLDLSGWRTSKLRYMGGMFEQTGYGASSFNIIGLNNFDVSNITSMSGLFYKAGSYATEFNIGDLSNWNVSNVTEMYQMFYQAGVYATEFNLGDLSNWNVSNVTKTYQMFTNAGQEASTWYIGDISKWNTGKVTNMRQMFSYAPYKADITLDLSGWNVCKVTSSYSRADFNTGVESKILAPSWGMTCPTT